MAVDSYLKFSSSYSWRKPVNTITVTAQWYNNALYNDL